MKHRLGWRKQKPDPRDHVYAVPPHVADAPLPANVDLRQWCPAVWDQGDLGACTAHAIAAGLQFDCIKSGQADSCINCSRLFIYYNERDMEGDVADDSGAAIRDGIKSVGQLGVCDENLWPYDVAKFAVRPPDNAYANAKKYMALRYAAVPQNLYAMRACLAEGFPIVLGVTVYGSFMSDDVDRTGDVPMPTVGEDCQGGHAIAIVGYRDDAQQFVFRNSWGPNWGDGGYGTLPYKYLVDPNLCDDLWTIRAVS